MKRYVVFSSRSVIIMLSLLMIWTASCAVLSKPYPEKNYYLLDTPKPQQRSEPTGSHSLQVSRFRISPQSEKKEFLYRISDSGFKQDFYNEFLISPDSMFTDIFRNWMDQTGLFASVTSRGSQMLPDFVLEGSIVSLYGDYRQSDSPRAVITIRLFLIDNMVTPPHMVWQKDYSQSVPIESQTSSDLVAGWNRALSAILAESTEAISQQALTMQAR